MRAGRGRQERLRDPQAEDIAVLDVDSVGRGERLRPEATGPAGAMRFHLAAVYLDRDWRIGPHKLGGEHLLEQAQQSDPLATAGIERDQRGGEAGGGGRRAPGTAIQPRGHGGD
jgi:hypothetical protein